MSEGLVREQLFESTPRYVLGEITKSMLIEPDEEERNSSVIFTSPESVTSEVKDEDVSSVNDPFGQPDF